MFNFQFIAQGRFELHGRKHKTRIEGTATNHYTQELEIPTIAEYTTVVVHCAFEFPVGADGKGGDLRMIANHGAYRKKRTPLGSQSVQFVALSEKAGVYDAALFNAPFKYEYLYCGGPLYGSVNPHRLREWLAYHMRLFGVASHFFFYDIGGMSFITACLTLATVGMLVSTDQQETYSRSQSTPSAKSRPTELLRLLQSKSRTEGLPGSRTDSGKMEIKRYCTIVNKNKTGRSSCIQQGNSLSELLMG